MPQPSSWTSLLSPQLWFSMRPKSPRTHHPLSRRVSPPHPPPQTLTSAANRSYVAVPSEWCFDNILESRVSYVSRDSFLRKMFQRTILYRTFNSEHAEKVIQEERLKAEAEILGTPVDYWLTFPLQLPHTLKSAEPPPLEGVALTPGQEVAHAWAIGPEKCSRKTLDRHAGKFSTGPRADHPLAFPWVTNVTSTNICNLEELLSSNVRKIIGFVECEKCGEILGAGYLLPRRIEKVMKHIERNCNEFVADTGKVLRNCDFYCQCDGLMNRGLPFISEDLRKINWLFLFLGCGLGHCTLDQLRYFCCQRSIPASDIKNDIVFQVCLAVYLQLDAEPLFSEEDS